MRRWHQEVQHMLRQKRACKCWHIGDDRYCGRCMSGIGTFRKRHAGDCGQTRCGCCHWEKFYYSQNRANKKREAIAFEVSSYAE